MDCPRCQHENREGRRFCAKCAAALPSPCPDCNFPNDPGDEFCGGCARSLAPESARQASEEAPPASKRAHLPDGERRQATVLFSDLSGFTAMSEKLDPEEVEGLMRRLKDRAVGIVEAHGGIVNQFVGDEVLALFGIPAAHEDDPLRAVRAAQEIHALARELSPEVEQKIGLPLAMHTGINTGLIVTSTADSRDGAVGVTGDTINTGARLKALAGDDAILLSPETARLVDAYVRVESLDPAELKGKAVPVTPYRVVGEIAAGTSRFEAATARHGLTALAGRERELATLQDALERAVGGEGQLVTVIGEAGVGKSRLLHEFRRRIDRDAVTVLEGRCQSYGAETPYLPFLDALRRGLRIHDLPDSAALHETAVTNIRAISPELKRYLPHLLHLLSIPSVEHKLPGTLQGEALRRELEAALAATITLNTAHRPMVVIYEDWHWADEASDAAINSLLGLVGHYPLLLMVLYRPEYQRRWGDVEQYDSIVLHSLDVVQTGRMLASVLGADDLPEGLAQAVHGRTGGNALFNEEIGHALRDEGMVEVDGGVARLTRPLEELTLPDTVHAVIRARVDRLEPADREILRLASVIGREFDRAVLEQIAPSATLADAALERLARQDLVHQVRVVPQAEYLFKHVLTQEVVYETLLLSQRKELHARVGAIIETLYPDRLEEHYEALAHHFAKSEERRKAVQYLELAGEKAAQYYSLEQAKRHFRAAIGLLDSRQGDAEQATARIDVTLKWAKVSHYQPTGELIPILERSASDADRLGDRHRLANVTYRMGTGHYIRAELTDAIAQLNRGIELARELEDEGLLALGLSAIGRASFYTGEYEKAIRHLEESVTMLERMGNLEDVAYSFGFLAMTNGYLGNFEQCSQQCESVLDIVERIGNKMRESAACIHVSLGLGCRGDWGRMIELGERAIEITKYTGDVYVTGCAYLAKGLGEFMNGSPGLGLAMMQEGIRINEDGGAFLGATNFNSWLAECSALAGRRVGAEAAIATVLKYSEQGENCGFWNVHRARALLAAQATQPDWSAAEASLAESRSLAETMGARPHLAITHFRYAECLHKKGDLDAARDQLDQAEALFREMGMDWWTKQAVGLRGRIDSGAGFVWFAPYIDGPPAVE